MEKQEFIHKIKALKKIKPDSEWVSFNRSILITKVASLMPVANVHRGFYWSFASKLTIGLASLALIFGGLLVSAQTAGITSPLYAIKTASQKALIAVMPKEYKLDLKIAFTHNLINDLEKVTKDNRAVVAVNNLNRDLNEITSDLKQVSHPQKAVALSKQIQEETSQIKNNFNNFPQDGGQLADSLKQINATVNDVDSQVFAVMNDAQNKIDNCPSYISKQVTDLASRINSISLSDSVQQNIANQILEANNYLKANRCIDALVIIDAINKTLSAPAK